METFDVYEPGVRLIYTYFDGQKKIKADPMVLWRKLKDVSGDLHAHSSVAFAPFEVKGKQEALAKVAEYSRKIFGVKPIEDEGLTEKECIDLLHHFWRYCDGVKKNSKDLPTPSEETSEAPANTLHTSER